MSNKSKKPISSSVPLAFSQPLISLSLIDSMMLPNHQQQQQRQLPIIQSRSQSLYPHAMHDTNTENAPHTLPMANIYSSSFNVEDSFSVNTDSLSPLSINNMIKSKHKNKKRKKPKRFRNTFAPTMRAPWNENVKDLLLRKLRNRRDTNSIRYIRRDKTAQSNVFSLGFIQQRGYAMLYHKLIDRPWLILICELALIYTSIYVFFATLFYYIHIPYNVSDNPDVKDLYEHNYWFLCFNFTVHTGTSIGFGYLLPYNVHTIASGFAMLALIYATEIFDTLFIGVLIKKIKKPTRLKTQLRFSEFAVINDGYSTTRSRYNNVIDIHTSLKFQSTYPRHKYSDFDYECGTIHDAGTYLKTEENDRFQCFMFRFCHIRPRSRMCMPSMKLIYYEHHIVDNNASMNSNSSFYNLNVDWMKHKHQELDFEIYRKYGRMRSTDNDVPFLSLPWTIVHKIDENSPLYGKTKQDLANKKIEIIAIVGGIDEITSDNFQIWWSYTTEEINWNHQFEPMVKSVLKTVKPWYYYLIPCLMYLFPLQTFKEVLEIHFDRLSFISPITEYMYT